MRYSLFFLWEIWKILSKFLLRGMLSLHHSLLFALFLFFFFFFVLYFVLTSSSLAKLHSRAIVDRWNVNMQFGRFLRRAILMNKETCAVCLREHVEYDRGTLRLARDFLQTSICGIASTRQSDKDNNAQYTKLKNWN